MGNNCNFGHNWGWIIVILIIVVFFNGNNGGFWNLSNNCQGSNNCGC